MKIVLLFLCFTVIISAQEDTTVVASPEEIIKYLPENIPEHKTVEDISAGMRKSYFSAEDDTLGANLLAALIQYAIHYRRQPENFVSELERELGKFNYSFNQEERKQDKPSANSKSAKPKAGNEVEDTMETIAILHFDYRSAIISESEYKLLDEMVDTMKTHPCYKWQIAGHVDMGEDTNQNKALAIERALIVKKYFMAKGINKNRLKIEFTGKDKFADETFNDDGEGAKRRVVISRLK